MDSYVFLVPDTYLSDYLNVIAPRAPQKPIRGVLGPSSAIIHPPQCYLPSCFWRTPAFLEVEATDMCSPGKSRG